MIPRDGDGGAGGSLLAEMGLVVQMRRKNLVDYDRATAATSAPALAPGAPAVLPGALGFTPEGAHRAELLIRRHRLAEKLFTETFQMEDAKVEAEACYFEHILSPDMTDRSAPSSATPTPARTATRSPRDRAARGAEDVGPVYSLAKLLQALALFLLLEGLFIGIKYGDMQTELMLLLGGMVLFFVGHRLGRSRSK